MERLPGGTAPPVHRKMILGIVLLVLILGAVSWAAVRLSASYEMTVDGLTAGGGAASSASYQAPANAIGEAAGFSQSTGYQLQSGVVQPIPAPMPPSRVNDWKHLAR